MSISSCPWRAIASATALLLPGVVRAQAPADSLASVRVAVLHDASPLAGALVRSGAATTRTDALGVALLRLPPREHALIVSRIGFAPETLSVVLRAAQDTTISIALEERSQELEGIIVMSTREERRIEDVPLRIEVLEEEEIEEKVFMTPGDIAMMLNETSGLRVQTTSPSLGGANVRIQGLRGRYTQLLSDGLPLYGGQTGGLGLLQIPPMDLGQVEVIKGAASALYGSSALGGVINLVSRRPGEEHAQELLLNQTTRLGSDAVLWMSGPASQRWGYTFLGGVHYQDARDIDDDAWADLPGYRRAVARPRVFWSGEGGSSAFLTAGATVESREGGTLGGRTTPSGVTFVEALDTRRADIGGAARFLVGRSVLAIRGSAMEQRHDHRFGDVMESDRHRTGFVEAALVVARDRAAWIAGVAVQRDDYESADVAGFDYAFTVPAVFAQIDLEPAAWLSMSASGRLDAHDEYGTFVNPRVSALLRASDAGALAGWTARASVGTGTFAPTPFTEETEVVGLMPLLRLENLRVERATTGSIDLTGPAGPVELVATVFASVVRDPVAVVEPPDAPGRLRLVNAEGPTRTAGTELLVRYTEDPWHVTASWTFIRSTELSPTDDRRRDVPLVPRHALGVVGMYEVEDRGRIGVELYYTGEQALDDDPWRETSRAHVILGALLERRFGPVRAFINFENIGDVRQTRWDPLVRPSPGPGGRWTTDAWTELAGRTINGGVRVEL